MRNRVALALVAVLALLMSTPPVTALSYSEAQDETITWTFVSPAAQLSEGIQITCLTESDLREDPIGDADALNEHIVFSCDTGTGTACDYPSWTPKALQDPAFCWDAADVSGCSGILYGFTGTLRIVPVEDAFEVTYDGIYGGWDGDC